MVSMFVDIREHTWTGELVIPGWALEEEAGGKTEIVRRRLRELSESFVWE